MICPLLTALVAAGGTSFAQQAPISVMAESDRVELVNGMQKVAWARNREGTFLLSTFVKGEAGWMPMFDGGLPLVQGADFGLSPTAYRVLDNGPKRAVVELSGRQSVHGYLWRLRVEAKAETSLMAFRLTCDISEPITLRGLEPQLALWMNVPRVDLALDQGPGNIYRGAADLEWGNSFPAAYLWHEGKEAAIFVEPTPMKWMSNRNLFRFRDCRVQSFSASGLTGFGLRVVKRNFHEVNLGKLVFEFRLHSAAQPDRPTRMEALDRLIRLVALLHPATAPQPFDYVAKVPATWSIFAGRVSENLMLKDIVWDGLPLPDGEPWRDGPAFPENTVSSTRISTDYAVDSACDPGRSRQRVRAGWDFSTCNNYLAGWIGYNRLNPDAGRSRFISAKTAALPLFYDPKAHLIRHGTRHPLNIGDREMSWQNFTFAIEMDKVRRLLAPDEFNPAIGGKFLQGADGLITLAHRVDYLFPQWFDPYEKKPIAQGDLPDLGIIREPWQAGSYSYIMCSAYEITGDAKYLTEAKTAVERLFGGMRFTVENQRYRVTYADPTEFPITEIFGNAWGVAACAKLDRWTGEARYREASDHFLDSLLRMTYWYESELRDDPKDLAVRNAGLFRNHSGAYTGSPWENGEAYLALTIRLRDEKVPREPLLRMFNVYRRNSFYFFPPVFPEAAQPCERLMNHAANYLPIEDTYTLEHGGLNGGMGRAIYMSGIAFWNYLMFEACAVTDDPDVMVLNLDVLEEFEESVRSARRNFIIFNPAPEARHVKFQPRQLKAGSYRLKMERAVIRSTVSAEELMEGVPMALAAGEHIRVTLEHEKVEQMTTEIREMSAAQHQIESAYQRLQESAGVEDSSDAFRRRKENYSAAIDMFRRADYQRAAEIAAGVQKDDPPPATSLPAEASGK